MHWRNSSLILVILFSSLLPIISAESNTEQIIEFDDASENIPNPSENHNITAISIDACQPSDCTLNNTIKNQIEIKGNFSDSDDKDSFWIQSNSDIKEITYEVCINSSTVPFSITPYVRSPFSNQLLSTGNALISEIPANNLICEKYPIIDENKDEFWIKIKSLSTSGNYSIYINSQQIGDTGQELIENSTHRIYMNKGVSTSSSIQNECENSMVCINVLNHSIKEEQLWNIELISDGPHIVELNCIMNDGEVKNICKSKESQYNANEDLFFSSFNYYTLKEISIIQIKIKLGIGPISWQIEHSLIKKSDPFMDIAEDAPGNISELQCEENKCKEFIANTGVKYSGSMPLSIFDEADVWMITLNGEEFDSYLVEIELLCDAGSIMLEIHSPNSNGTMNITYLVPTTSMYETLQIELFSGTHYIRLVNLRLGNVQDWEYGDLNKSITTYEIQMKSIQNQTTNNDTYVVSEELLYWDNILLWFMGFCFISPMIWVLFNLRKDTKRMELLLHDRARLARLRKLTQNSEIEEAKLDLSVFIRSITKLDWDVLLDTWGNPDLSYITEAISINSWKLDSSLANEDGIPILIIIETHQTDWEISALKFESTSHTEWKVVSLQPNLLHRNNEIFLDTIKVGNKIFLEAEIKGLGKDIQMHISGMSNGAPVAVKSPNSISCDEEE